MVAPAAENMRLNATSVCPRTILFAILSKSDTHKDEAQPDLVRDAGKRLQHFAT